MFKARVTNLGTADQYGNRACLEFSDKNTELCALVWQTFNNLEAGIDGPVEAMTRNVVGQILDDNTKIAGRQNALYAMKTNQLFLERNKKGKIISPKAQRHTITFAEKVDQHGIVDEFLSIASQSQTQAHRVKALVAWMQAQFLYSDMQMLIMDSVVNCVMVWSPELSVALLNMGDSSAEPIRYLHEFSGEDAVFVQEWKDDLISLEEAGATKSFAENAKVITNRSEEENVVACIADETTIDLTDIVTREMKSTVSANELLIKPYRFTMTFHNRKGAPRVAVINWHAKKAETTATEDNNTWIIPYEELFAAIVAKLFKCAETALGEHQITEDVCILLVADSNLPNMDVAQKAARLLQKNDLVIFNHSTYELVDGKSAVLAKAQRNVLMCNVNRNRRFSVMTRQWEKARPETEPTAAPKGVVITRMHSKFNVSADCKKRQTPGLDYKLDHGHFTITVTEKQSNLELWIAFVLLIVIALAAASF